MRPIGWLAAVMAAFLGLALVFAWSTPYRQSGVLLNQRGPDGLPAKVPDVGAPDERQHANYVSHILEGRGLPVFKPGSPDLYETYQAHQPPLFYAVGAAWCRILAIDPKSGGQSTGLKLRALNVLIGLVTVLGLFYGAKALFGKEDWALAAAATALLPMSLALHGAVSNDPLLIALCTWCLVGLVMGVKVGFGAKTVLLVGLAAGLALLTKTTALALFPAIVVGLLVSKVKDPKIWAGCLLLPLAMATPLWLRNQGLYGDPFALKAFNEAFVGSPQASAFIDGIGPWAYWTGFVLWWTSRSLIGVFGYMDVFLFEGLSRPQSAALYNAMIFVLILIMTTGIVWSIKSSREDQGLWAGFAPVTVFALVVGLLFVRFNMQYFQGQGRYLYPALAPVAWLLAAGIMAKFKGRELIGREPTVRFIVWFAALLALAVVSWSGLGPAFLARTAGSATP